MVRDSHTLMHELERFEPEDGNWLPLDDLVQEIIISPAPEQTAEAMMGLFERHPEEDGYGIFWTMLREIERFPGYEKTVFESLNRKPSMFSVLMVGRMLTSDRYANEAEFLAGKLRAVLADPAVPECITDAARAYLERHGG